MIHKNLFFWLVMAGGLVISCKQHEQVKSPERPFDAGNKHITVYTTADSTDLRLTLTDTLFFKPAQQPVETEISVFVNPAIQFQTFLGIGGSFTDAASEVFARLSKEQQNELLTAYFSRDNGIGYTLARTTIQSSDFSSGSYSYVTEGDKELTSFTVEHDLQFRIPFIRQAIRYAGGKLTLFASPWSPPAFMKDNHNILRGGKLLPEYYQLRGWNTEGIPTTEKLKELQLN